MLPFLLVLLLPMLSLLLHDVHDDEGEYVSNVYVGSIVMVVVVDVHVAMALWG